MTSAFCPYPGSCEYDDYKRLGVHYCARVECPYKLQAKKLLLVEIHRLEALEKLTLQDLHWLQRLKREYGDGAHTAPDGQTEKIVFWGKMLWEDEEALEVL